MTCKDAQKPLTDVYYDMGEYVVLDSQLLLVIDSKRGEIPRDEFIAKILAHALGLSDNGFGDKS